MKITIIMSKCRKAIKRHPGCSVLIFATSLPLNSWAAFEHGLMNSHYGVLHVYGTLTESACRLDMSSADQSVEIGNIATAALKNVGDQGPLIPVALYLHDCLRSASDLKMQSDNVAWSAHQPAVSFTFTGIGDAANPQLIEAKGVNGMALRVKDASRNNVILGQQGKPLRLAPGDDVVIYYVTPERTRGELRGGSYSANINFRLNYE